MKQDLGGASSKPETADPRGVIERWETFGGTWRIVEDGHADAGGVTVALCRCDAGEEVERVTSTDTTLWTWLHRRAAAVG